MSGIMILLFVIFGLTYAHVVHDTNRCINHGGFCDVMLDNQCCSGYKCKSIIDINGSSTAICSKKEYLNKSCEHDEDCGDPIYTKCKKIDWKSGEKKCVCRSNTVVKNNSTCQSLLGWFCEDDNQCAVKDSVCGNHICKCGQDYIPLSNDRCGPYPLGKPCHLTKDCENLVFSSRCSKDYFCTFDWYKGTY